MLHFLDRLLEANEQRMSDDGVTDVQLIDTTDGGDGLGVVVVQTMPGIDDQSVAETDLDTVANPRQFAGTFRHAVSIGITTGVQFDGRCADPVRPPRSAADRHR